MFTENTEFLKKIALEKKNMFSGSLVQKKHKRKVINQIL